MPGKGTPEDEDDLLENAYVYLTDQCYPGGSSTNEKRAIRRKAEKFVLRNGELLYKKSKKMADGTKV